VDDQLLLTVPEAAKVLRVSRAFTYELIARGDLPVVRLGRRVLIPREELERHVRASIAGPG
jgi:excisionase family DNA binding protein